MPGIRTIVIKTIEHNNQRYDTLGDWIVDGDVLTVYTSDLGDWRMSIACAIHEAIEASLCVQDGVKEEDVSRFDVRYEKARELSEPAPCGCTPTEDSEPGEDRHAPYRKQHAFADGVERLFANALGVVWSEYSDKVTNLEWNPKEDDSAATQTPQERCLQEGEG